MQSHFSFLNLSGGFLLFSMLDYKIINNFWILYRRRSVLILLHACRQSLLQTRQPLQQPDPHIIQHLNPIPLAFQNHNPKAARFFHERIDPSLLTGRQPHQRRSVTDSAFTDSAFTDSAFTRSSNAWHSRDDAVHLLHRKTASRSATYCSTASAKSSPRKRWRCTGLCG